MTITCSRREEFREDWDDFVCGHPEGTFFHLWGWRNVLSESFGYEPYYICAEEMGTVVGVLPLFLVRSYLFGRSLITIPMGVYGGPLAINEAAEGALLSKAEDLLQRTHARYLEVRGNPYRQSELNFPQLRGGNQYARKDLYVTFIGEIGPTSEANLARIPRKQRRMIRQGQKYGLNATFDNGRLDEWYAIYAASVKNLGTPVYSYRYFKKLLGQFNDRCKVLLIDHGSKPVAGVVSFFFKDQVLPYYGGALRDCFHLAPNDFMYWELLSYGAANNYRVFDFGRSKQGTGSFDFKRHWGFEPRPLTYWYRCRNGLAVPDTSPLNPKLQWAIRIWKNLPLPVTMGLGPVIARHLP